MAVDADSKKTIKDSQLNYEQKEGDVKVPKYSDKERDYLGRFQIKLESSKTAYNEPRPEFDNMTVSQYYLENERIANTMLKPKKNRSDIVYQSGTLEDKMMSLLSSIQGLNLTADISAFDTKNLKVNALGNAIEDIIEKTEEVEKDKEKKMLRQYELLKQGTYYAEEIWEHKWLTKKTITQPFSGKIESAKWSTPRRKRDKMGQAKRNFIPITGVYLGDWSQYFIENQPFIFTVQEISYEAAKALYGDWERWEMVSREKREFSGDGKDAMASNAWRLSDIGKGRVEIIRYQDKPNLEYQIILNGVPMLPMGYPFPWGYDEYNISQQNLRPFRQDFAIGKSFIFKNKNIARLLDEMIRLALLKTQKSFMPAYNNNTGRVITSRALMPGKINMGLGVNPLTPMSEKEAQGVTNSEFAMIQDLSQQLDRKTVSQTFGGQKEAGGKVTATQIVELQRQARIMMGIVILSVSWMEEKLTALRLMNILQNWFSPIDQVVDEARQVLRNKYRITTQERATDKGMGLRITLPTDELPTKENLRATEESIGKRVGRPVRIVALKPDEIKESKYTWMVRVNPKERKSSELNKLVFQEMVIGAMNMGLQWNPEWLQQQYADMWEGDVNKMFMQVAGQGIPLPPGAPALGGTAKATMGAGQPKPASPSV